MTEKEVRQKFVDKAISFIGSDEGSDQHKYIIDQYNKITPLPANYKLKYTDHWCAGFVSSIASMCDLLDIIPAECSCSRMISLAKNMGIFQELDSYIPEVGDLLIYDWQDSGIGDNKGAPDHIGIVVSVEHDIIKVIEGNIKNTVDYREIKVNGRYIRGFITPKFENKATKEITKVTTCNVKLPVLSKGSRGISVKALQRLLIGHGYSVGSSGADGNFGTKTLNAVKKFQKDKKIGIDGSVGPQTWAKLIG